MHSLTLPPRLNIHLKSQLLCLYNFKYAILSSTLEALGSVVSDLTPLARHMARASQSICFGYSNRGIPLTLGELSGDPPSLKHPQDCFWHSNSFGFCFYSISFGGISCVMIFLAAAAILFYFLFVAFCVLEGRALDVDGRGLTRLRKVNSHHLPTSTQPKSPTRHV